jgi:WD40 repeat protein/tetratricopeptide (TPR) repeat protein
MIPPDLERSCQLFEAAWQSGQRSRIEDILRELPNEYRDEAFKRLLEIELRCRRAAQEVVSVDDYSERFPELVAQTIATLKNSPARQGLDTVEWQGAAMQETTPPAGAPRIATPAGQQLPRPFGEYELLSEIARGGMGVVFRARQVKLNRPVAIKMILSGEFANEEHVQRFYSEAEAAANLDHPGIVPIHEVGQQDGQHFFSMGFVDGQSLSALIKDGPLPPREAAKLLAQIVSAVRYAHEHGVIHRDLKPANVLLDVDGHPRVTDFGLAKRVTGDSGLTASGQIMGTPSYMPPEQAAGRIDQIGPAADIYSLGAILYEMLTGRPPFRAATPVDTLRQVLEREPAEPRKLNPAIDRDLETICLKCLAKQPRERYASAVDLHDELTRYLSGEPIHARRLGVLPRAWRWCKRKPVLAGMYAATCAAVVLMIALAIAGQRAKRVEQLGNLRAAFEAGLRRVSPESNYLDEMDATIAVLRSLDEAEANSAHRKLVQEYARAVKAAIVQTELTSSSEQQFQVAIEAVRLRDASLADELSTTLAGRIAQWRTIVDLRSPFADYAALFPAGEVALKGSQLNAAIPVRMRETFDAAGVARKTPDQRILLTTPCGSNVELEATLAENWDQAGRVGVVVNARDVGGYSFLVRLESTGLQVDAQAIATVAATTFAQARQVGGDVTVEMRKGDAVLQRAVWPAERLPAGPLVLRAKRERDRLTFQVNAQPPLEFRDVFSSAMGRGALGVDWPKNVGLTGLRVRAMTAPAIPRPIELADEKLDAGDAAAALVIYEEQSGFATTDADRAETAHKQALCLTLLNRPDDAARLYEQARASRQEPWSLLAGCQLWLQAVRERQVERADAIYDELGSGYTFEQLAGSVPVAERGVILTAYFSGEFEARTATGLRRIERAAAIDRFLSASGQGDSNNQRRLIKAVELAGLHEKALTMWEELSAAFPNDTYSRYRRSMLLRVMGRPQMSLQLLDQAIEEERRRQLERVPWDLLLERFRTLAALRNWPAAWEAVEEARRLLVTDTTLENELARRCQLTSHIYLSRGFIQEELGRPDDAFQSWTIGYQQARPALGRVDAADDWTVLNCLILGSLSGQLEPSDTEAAVVLIGGSGKSQQIVKLVFGQLGGVVLQSTLSEMWKRPRGRQMARDDYAFFMTPYNQRMSGALQLAFTEYVRQSAFGEEMRDDQERVVWEGAGEVLGLYRSNRISLLSLASIFVMWQSPNRASDIETLFASFTPRQQGLADYIYGHRMLYLDAPPSQVAALLRKGVAKLAEDSPERAVVEREIRQLDAEQGELAIRAPLGRPAQLHLQRQGDEVVTHLVDRAAELELPAGIYNISASAGDDEIGAAPGQVELKAGRRNIVVLSDRWQPSASESALPGLVAQPASLPGVDRWQMCFRCPVSPIRCVAWSPAGDRYAAAGRDAVIRIFDASNGEPLHFLLGHTAEVIALAWSPDGTTLASGGIDGIMRLWDTKEARLITNVTGHKTAVTRLAFSPDGQWLASGSWDHSVRLWSPAGVAGRVMDGHQQAVTGLAWSPDSTRIASIGGEQTLLIRQAAVEADPVRIQLSVQPNDVSWSGDGGLLAVSSGAAGVSVFDTTTWRETRQLQTPKNGITGIAWRPGNRQIAAVGWMGRILLWDAAGESDLPNIVKSIIPQGCLDWTDDGARLLTGSYDGLVRQWDAELNTLAMQGTPMRSVQALAWQPDGSKLAVACRDSTIRLFDEHAQPAETLCMSSHTPTRLAWDASGERLAASVDNSQIHIWKLNDESPKQLTPHRSAVFAIAWGPNGQFASAAQSDELRIWTPELDKYRAIANLERRVVALAWNQAGVLAAADGSATVRLWNTADSDREQDIDVKGSCNAIAWRPDGTHLAAAANNNILILTPDGAIQSTWKGQRGSIRSLAWSADFAKLISASLEGTIRIWGKSGGELLTIDTSRQAAPELMALHPAGKLLAAAAEQPWVVLYDTETGLVRATIALLSDGRAARIYPGGKVSGPAEVIEQELVYVAVDKAGVFRWQTHTIGERE